MAEYKHLTSEDIKKFKQTFEKIRGLPPYNENINMVYALYTDGLYDTRYCKVVFFNTQDTTRLTVKTTQPRLDNAKGEILYFTFIMDNNSKISKLTGGQVYGLTTSQYEIKAKSDRNESKCLATTFCPSDDDNFKQNFPIEGLKEVYTLLQEEFNFKKQCGVKVPPTPGKSQQQEYFFIDKAETMKYLQGQDITISCEVDGDIELESGGVLFQYQLEGQDTYTDIKAEVTTSSTGKKRIWVRVKLP